jgi:hypothetical protein
MIKYYQKYYQLFGRRRVFPKLEPIPVDFSQTDRNSFVNEFPLQKKTLPSEKLGVMVIPGELVSYNNIIYLVVSKNTTHYTLFNENGFFDKLKIDPKLKIVKNTYTENIEEVYKNIFNYIIINRERLIEFYLLNKRMKIEMTTQFRHLMEYLIENPNETNYNNFQEYKKKEFDKISDVSIINTTTQGTINEFSGSLSGLFN